MIPIRKIQAQGQSVWLDHTSKSFKDDQLREWIESGWIGGITSSVGLTVGQQAHELLTSPDLRLLSHAGMQDEEILLDLIVAEYRAAADLLLPIFEHSNGEDGFITVEINPHTYPHQDEMLQATEKVWNLINRPNLLISIPASEDTIDVLSLALDQGINVNATLISSPEQYLDVLEAYISALEGRMARGAGIEHVVSTVSFFIADIDQHINQELEKFKGDGTEASRARTLIDEIGLAIAKLAYAQFVVSFRTERFSRLAEAGGRVQRILWMGLANNKNKTPWDYMRHLIAPDTITTTTFAAMEGSQVADEIGQTLEEGLSEARSKLTALESLGVMIEPAAEEIQRSRVEDKRTGYTSVIHSLLDRVKALSLEIEPNLGRYQQIVSDLDSKDISSRIWQADTSLWTEDRKASRKISERLGWLDLPQHIRTIADDCRSFAAELKAEDIRNLVVICPGSVGDLLRAIGYGLDDPTLHLFIYNPDAADELARILEEIETVRTHFVYMVGHAHRDVLNDKSGEAWARLQEQTGMDPAEQATLVAGKAAAEAFQKSGREFKQIFALPEDIPFHFAGLSFPGMITAAWAGLDLEDIRAGVSSAMTDCLPAVLTARNPGLALAAAIASELTSDHGQIMLTGGAAWSPYMSWMERFFLDAGILLPEQVGHIRIEDATEILSKEKRPLVIMLREPFEFEKELETLAAMDVPVKILEFEACPFSAGRLVGLVSFTNAALGHLLAVNPFIREGR